MAHLDFEKVRKIIHELAERSDDSVAPAVVSLSLWLDYLESLYMEILSDIASGGQKSVIGIAQKHKALVDGFNAFVSNLQKVLQFIEKRESERMRTEAEIRALEARAKYFETMAQLNYARALKALHDIKANYMKVEALKEANKIRKELGAQRLELEKRKADAHIAMKIAQLEERKYVNDINLELRREKLELEKAKVMMSEEEIMEKIRKLLVGEGWDDVDSEDEG